MHQLDEKDYGRIRPLLGDLINYNVSIDSVLEGNNPGVVYVDDPAAPQVVLLIGPEGTYLGGEVPSAARVTALRDWLTDLADRQRFEALWLDCVPAWKDQVASILPWPPMYYQPRQHYVCKALALDWRAHTPDGFAVLPITRALLDRTDMDIPDHVHNWMQGNWGSTESFLARGFGFVTEDIAHHRVVSWSLCDCIGGGACEIGIHTHPDYRRRGLAAITAAAAAEHALAHVFRSVGWHCNVDNMGSRRTALKVGFVWERDYVHCMCFRSKTPH